MKKVSSIKNIRFVLGSIFCLIILAAIFQSLGIFPFAKASSSSPSNQLTDNILSFTPSPTPTPNNTKNPEPTATPFDPESINPDGMLGSSDVDCDGVENSFDNCLFTYNPKQKDRNKNGVGDVCEPDPRNPKIIFLACDGDGDGVNDEIDNCPAVCNPDQKDANENKVGDVCDPTLPNAILVQKPCTKRIKLKKPKWLKQ